MNSNNSSILGTQRDDNLYKSLFVVMSTSFRKFQTWFEKINNACLHTQCAITHRRGMNYTSRNTHTLTVAKWGIANHLSSNDMAEFITIQTSAGLGNMFIHSNFEKVKPIDETHSILFENYILRSQIYLHCQYMQNIVESWDNQLFGIRKDGIYTIPSEQPWQFSQRSQAKSAPC